MFSSEDYLNTFSEKVKENWTLPFRLNDYCPELQSTLVYKIAPDGGLHNLRMIGSSGLNTFDQSALKAIQSTVLLERPACGLEHDLQTFFAFNFESKERTVITKIYDNSRRAKL